MLHTTKHRESTSSPSPLRLFGGERLYWREYRRRRESELPITALEQDSYRENRTAKSTTSRETQRDVRQRGRGAQSEHVYNRGVHRFCRRLGQPASLSPAPYSTQPLQSVGSGWSSSGLFVLVLGVVLPLPQASNTIVLVPRQWRPSLRRWACEWVLRAAVFTKALPSQSAQGRVINLCGPPKKVNRPMHVSVL